MDISVRDLALRCCSVAPSASTTTPPLRSPSRKWKFITCFIRIFSLLLSLHIWVMLSSNIFYWIVFKRKRFFPLFSSVVAKPTSVYSFSVFYFLSSSFHLDATCPKYTSLFFKSICFSSLLVSLSLPACVIRFTPDFTSSWVIRDLTLVTSRGTSFPFTLNVTLPHHMLPLCAQVVPGPSWEETFWVVTLIFTWLVT